MAGVRVKNIPKEVKDKTLKIHFSKPENGGGKIQKIYFPLFNNDAVILFERRKVVETILRTEHTVGSHTLEVQNLPEHMIFTNLDGKLDMASSVLIQATQSLRDEMEFGENIQITEETDGTYRIHGNWFQLEWAWHYIDCFMQQQEIIQHEISQQPQRYAGTPKEVDQSEYMGRPTSPAHRVTSPTDVNSDLHRNIAQHSQLVEAAHGSHGVRQMDDDSHSYNDSLTAYRDKGEQRKTKKDDLSIRMYETEDAPSPTRVRSPLEDMSGLKRNIESSYTRMGRDSGSTQGSGDDDHLGLNGKGYEVPLDTLHSLPTRDNRRSEDENQTFQQFSGLASMPYPATSSLQHDLKTTTRDQGHSVDIRTQGQGHLYKDQRQENDSSGHSTPTKSSSLLARKRDSPQTVKVPDTSAKTTVGALSGVSTPPRVKPSAMLSQLPERYTEDQLLCTFDINGLKTTLYYGNLIMEETDAIVNAANESLQHYGGIAYVILKARGQEMDDECRRHIRRNGNLKTTEVMHTSGGGNLKCAHIIHAAGPMWISERGREDFTAKLTQTFLNCLKYADERLFIKSLALPVISSGVYGAPLDACVRCFLDAVLIFTSDNEDHRLQEVHLVNNDAESTVTSIVLVQTQLDSTGISALTSDALQHVKASPEGEMNLPRGRKDSGSNFAKTLTYGDADTVSKSLQSSTWAAPKRSSSLSRVSRKESPDTSDQGVDRYSRSSATGYDSRSPHSSSITDRKSRPRTTSYDDDDVGTSPKHRSSDFSKTVTAGMAGSGYSLHADASERQKHSPASGDSGRTQPKLKQSLLSTDNTRVKSYKTSTVGPRTSDDYGAFTKKKSTYSSRLDTSDDSDSGYGLHSLPMNLHTPSYREQFLGATAAPEAKIEICAICLDEISHPKELKCKHRFCSPCLQQHFMKSKPSCPTCGSLYGRLVGDQPSGGRMTYVTDRSKSLPGYDREDGMIIITYTFPDGRQESSHPNPGRQYKGLIRKAYLPNCSEGREVLRLLRKAFDARLVFTIGDSKTSGHAGVLTWNDIHHKTNMTGGPTRFGYPDTTYLQRVRGELADKGIISGK